jgi:predicted permease
MWDDLRQDVRLSLRALRQAPGYTAAAVLTLALGIGANSAIFSLGNAALMRAAPVRSPETLVAVWTTCRAGDARCSSSYPDYLDYRDRSALLEDLAGYAFTRANLRGDGGARLLSVQASTGNYFELLGVDTAVGRTFTPEDERERRLVAVLTEELWNDQFGGDPGIVGRRVRLNSATFEIIGVTAEGFRGLHLGDGPDIFVPLLSGPALETGYPEDDSRFTQRGSRWISQLVGRLAPGATVEQARAELLAISDQLAAEDPGARGPRRVTVESARQLIGPASDSGELSRFVWLLGGVVGFTLLLACANLANLLLARASGRQRELGVRLALGATRSRIARQMLTESIVLALLGGAAGLLVGGWLLSLLAGYQLPGGISIGRIGAGLDPLALAFTAALALLTGVAFGMAPALQATRVELDAGMRAGGRGVVAGGGRLRGALVAVQLALCLVLLTGAGLFLQALRNGLDSDLGFPVGGLAVAAVDLGVLQYGPEQGRAFTDTLTERLEALPGVTAAGIGTRAPMLPGGTATMLHSVEGYQPGADEELRLEYTFVSEGYLRALGLPLLHGGSFTGSESPESRPMIVNRDMAERWWPGRAATGGRVYFFDAEAGPGQTGDIVGVVENTKWDDGITTPDYPFAYLPLAASASWVSGRVVILARTQGDAGALLPALRAELAAVEPDASIMTLATMESLLDDVLMPQHMGARLFGWFAVLSLVLAAIGIYSVMAYSVSQRRRDIGVRMALGATRSDIVLLVVGGIAVPLVAGLAGGLGIARLLAGTISGFLYGVSATDPSTIAAVCGGLVAVALLAGLLPARRAMRVDPTVSLRAD